MKTYDQNLLESIQMELLALHSFLIESELHKMGLVDDESHKNMLNDLHTQLTSFLQRIDYMKGANG